MLDPKKLVRELELQGLTLSELHVRSGMNYSHLCNMKNGKIQHVKFRTVLSLARYLNNIPPYRLIRDSILDIARQEIFDSIQALPREHWPSYLQETLESSTGQSIYVNRFPIIGHIRENGVHDLPENLNGSNFSKGSYSTVPFDGINDPDAYAVISEDRALSLDIKQGSVLLMAPKYKVDHNSLCLVRTKAEDKVWIRYLLIRDDHFILTTKVQFDEPVIIESKDAKYVHRCVGRHLVERPLRLK